MSDNGHKEVRFDYPPTVPPANGFGETLIEQPRVEPEKQLDPDEPTYKTGFFADLFCWWRSRRERHLIEKIRSLEQKVVLLEEENLIQAGMIINISRWQEASTLVATKLQAQVMLPERPAGIARPPQR